MQHIKKRTTNKLHNTYTPQNAFQNNVQWRKQLLQRNQHYSLVTICIRKKPACRVKLPAEPLWIPWLKINSSTMESHVQVTEKPIRSIRHEMPGAKKNAWHLVIFPKRNLTQAVGMAPQVQHTGEPGCKSRAWHREAHQQHSPWRSDLMVQTMIWLLLLSCHVNLRCGHGWKMWHACKLQRNHANCWNGTNQFGISVIEGMLIWNDM